MHTEISSLEFTGPRRSLFYFMVALSSLALFSAAGSMISDFVNNGGLTADNIVLLMSSSNGTVMDMLFGGQGRGTLAGAIVTTSGISWLVSSFAWLYTFLAWREFMKSDRKRTTTVFYAFTCTFALEMLGILSWPLHVGPMSYAFGLFQLGLAGYVCLPVIREFWPNANA